VKIVVRTVAALAAFVLASPSFAQERAEQDTLPIVRVPPIVVTATRSPTSTDRIGSSVSVIGRDEIELYQYRTVAEALRGVPGISVTRTGGPGAATSVFVRGADSDKVLVLVDGVEMNDPSSPADAFDFAHMTTDDVERIEILRGPQGPLYGSRATAGVIHVFTRRGEGSPTVSGFAETGEFGTTRATAGVRGGSETVSWAVTVARDETDGISAVSASEGAPEDDEDRRTTLTGRASWRPVERVEAGFTVRRLTADTGIDQGTPGGDDPNFFSDTDRTTGRAFVSFGGPGDRWEGEIAVGFVGYDRTADDEPDDARPETFSRGRFEGTRTTVEGIGAVSLGGLWRVSGGVETEREEAESSFVSGGEFGPFESEFPEQDARTIGAWGQVESGVGPLHVVVGGRIDDHDRFGAASTWRVAPVLDFADTGTRIRGSWGTGFKSPTLFQLFDPEFGDVDLEPEESEGWDVGVEQSAAGDRIVVSATWFDQTFEDLVGFSFPDGFANIEAAETHGLELQGSVRLATGYAVRAGYTYTDAEDRDPGGESRGEPLLRRPQHQFDLDVATRPHPRARVALGLRHVGEREDLDFAAFPAERVTLDAYTLVRLSGDVELTGRLVGFVRVENLFDESYTEAFGFNAPGRAAYVGIRLGGSR